MLARLRPAAPVGRRLAARASVRFMSDEGGGSSMHSTDIAFKPTEDGWGYTNKYSKGWDNIFNKKDKPAAEEAPPAAAADAAALALRAKQNATLDAALECGALSKELFSRAMAELDGK